MRSIAVVSLMLLFAFVGSGCTLVAPQYTASMENVQKLKDAGDYSMKVGTFSADKNISTSQSIQLRAHPLTSPYNASYAGYLSEAIKQELVLAGKLTPDSKTEITSVLMKNDLNTNSGEGIIEAQFLVKKDGQVRYDQVKSARTEWETSFVGAIAIPRAQQEYPTLVQKLLATLYADQMFIDALK